MPGGLGPGTGPKQPRYRSAALRLLLALPGVPPSLWCRALAGPNSPGWAGAAVRVVVGFVMSVSGRAGGGQVAAGDVVDLDAVGSGQQRGVLAGSQFGGHDRTLGGVEGLD